MLVLKVTSSVIKANMLEIIYYLNHDYIVQVCVYIQWEESRVVAGLGKVGLIVVCTVTSCGRHLILHCVDRKR